MSKREAKTTSQPAVKQIRLAPVFRPSGQPDLEELSKFASLVTEATCRRPSRGGNVHCRCVRKKTIKTSVSNSTAARKAHDGLVELLAFAENGNEVGLRQLVQHAVCATQLVGFKAKQYPDTARIVARGEYCWPLIVFAEDEWLEMAERRTGKLDLGTNVPFPRACFRRSRGTDADYPARCWAKAAVRTLEDAKWRVVTFFMREKEIKAVVAAKGWEIAPIPLWAYEACSLSRFTEKSCPAWAIVIRRMIRSEIRHFETDVAWRNQRRAAQESGTNSKYRLQNAILDDICRALRTVAPVTDKPKSAT